MKNKIKEMVTCDGEIGRPHMPVTFEGRFRALCPLCRLMEIARDAAGEIENPNSEDQKDRDDAAGLVISAAEFAAIRGHNED